MIEVNFEHFCSRSDMGTSRILEVKSMLPIGWLAGGAIRRVLTGMEPGDYDFFFQNEKHFEVWNEDASRQLKQTKKTEHHVQYEGELGGVHTKIQGINFSYFNTIEDMLNVFDFTLCQFAIDNKGTMYTTPEALWDLGRKRLVVNQISYPVSTMRRVLKYTNQGYTACSGCLQSVLMAPIENPDLQLQMEVEYLD